MTAEQKVIIVTGSNSGIGYRAALGLAHAGHRVVMMCRSETRGQAARQRIIQETNSPDVDLIAVDLSSQASIRAAVQDFTARSQRLDVLINNAANFDITMKQRQLTAEGVETIFATNHLGPFLMTGLLLDTLRRSAPSRIINIASMGLLMHPFLSIEFDNLHGQKKYSPQHAYYHSKLAQVMWTYDLAERLAGSGVTVNCIRVPNVRLDEDRYAHIPALLRTMYRVKMRFAIPAESMAQAYITLATDPAYEQVTGAYFDEKCRQVKSSRRSYDRELWRRLWQVSTELTQAPVPVHSPTL